MRARSTPAWPLVLVVVHMLLVGFGRDRVLCIEPEGGVRIESVANGCCRADELAPLAGGNEGGDDCGSCLDIDLGIPLPPADAASASHSLESATSPPLALDAPIGRSPALRRARSRCVERAFAYEALRSTVLRC